MKYLKHFILFIIIICVSCNTYGIEITQDILNEYKDYNYIYKAPTTKEENEQFMNALNNHQSIDSVSSNIQFVNGTSLLIGHSLTVGAFRYCGKNWFKKYKCDAIVYGASIISNCIEWLKCIEDKYDRIILWTGTNDLTNYATWTEVYLRDSLCFEVEQLFDEARKHLNRNGIIIFIRGKEIKDNEKHNDLLHQFNAWLDSYVVSFDDIRLYESSFEMSKEYSNDGIHYKNKEPYESVMIDCLNME